MKGSLLIILSLAAVSLALGAPALDVAQASSEAPYVLIVSNETSGVDVPQYQYQIYENILTALGVDYNVWFHKDNGEPSLGDLNPYNVVIWVSGNSCGYPASHPLYGHQAITLAEEATLVEWLNSSHTRGVILAGFWIAYNCVADAVAEEQLPSLFFDYYMGLDYPSENFNDWIEVDDNWTLTSAGGNLSLGDHSIKWASVENYPDMLDTSIGAVEAFWTDPDGVDNQAAIISYEGSSWRSVFLACPLESVSGPTNRNAIMQSILDWFFQGAVSVRQSSWGMIKAAGS